MATKIIGLETILLVGVLDAKKCKNKLMLICLHFGSLILLKNLRSVFNLMFNWIGLDFKKYFSAVVTVNIQIDFGTIQSSINVKNLGIFIA